MRGFYPCLVLVHPVKTGLSLFKRVTSHLAFQVFLSVVHGATSHDDFHSLLVSHCGRLYGTFCQIRLKVEVIGTSGCET